MRYIVPGLAMGAVEPVVHNLSSCMRVKSINEPFVKYLIAVAECRQLCQIEKPLFHMPS